MRNCKIIIESKEDEDVIKVISFDDYRILTTIENLLNMKCVKYERFDNFVLSFKRENEDKNHFRFHGTDKSLTGMLIEICNIYL